MISNNMPIPTSPHGRLDALTAVRGIAALMVVLFHARGSWHPIFASGERISMLVASGWLWVHFFFVLSGFVMM
jgi:peptidoglycan/LPS O-acetylase OafA/YrhL